MLTVKVKNMINSNLHLGFNICLQHFFRHRLRYVARAVEIGQACHDRSNETRVRFAITRCTVEMEEVLLAGQMPTSASANPWIARVEVVSITSTAAGRMPKAWPVSATTSGSTSGGARVLLLRRHGRRASVVGRRFGITTVSSSYVWIYSGKMKLIKQMKLQKIVLI